MIKVDLISAPSSAGILPTGQLRTPLFCRQDAGSTLAHRMIAKRKPDYNRFIEPQAKCADVIFNLIPVNPDLIDKITDKKIDESNLKLRVFIRNGIYYHELVRILIGVCGLHVNIESIDEKGEVIIEVNGDVSSEDAKLAAHVLLPHMDELLGYEAEFSKGTLGLMQIITLMEIDEALKRRKKN